MHIFKTSLHVFLTALLAGVVLSTSLASAASQCKGIQQDACAATAECVWVNGYVRKDGRSVNSHCKSKGGKKTAHRASGNALNLSAADKP